MGQEITLFSGYDQPENRTTNYCLLVLRQLYQANPALLAQALDALLPGQASVQVGVQFRQQTRRGDAVPDGLISQPAFTVYIETKHAGAHYDEQLMRHARALADAPAGAKVLLALAKFEGSVEGRFAAVENYCAIDLKGEVKFVAASFESFLAAVQSAALPLALVALADEFEQYLNQQGLLPDWQGRLDVVNCGQFHAELEKHEVYVCPALGGAHSHRRCQYLGMYWSKAAQRVADVWGVVDVDLKTGTAELLWNNDPAARSDKTLIEEARQRFTNSWPGADWEGRVFVLGKLHETFFKKDSPGGMQAAKRYFDVRPLKAGSAADLAAKLQGKDWDNLS